MKTILTLLLVVVFTQAAFSQLMRGQIDCRKVPSVLQHYLPEYAFDQPADPTQWTQQKSGLHVSFATTDELHLRTEVPQIPIEHSWKSTGWRGERVHKQILIWSPDTISQVRFSIGDLVGTKGQTIDKKNIIVSMVRYVLSNYPYAAKDANCGAVANDTAFLMPDRFEAFDRFDLPGKTIRPVWLSVQIPAETSPDTFSGTIEVNSTNGKAVLNVVINVQSLVLPNPHDWKFRLDLWQNPWVVADYFKVKPWSSEHMMLLKKHLKPYADAGGKYITTYAVHSPWSDNSYMVEGGMIEWIKHKNDSWAFDYTIFDQYVQLAMDCGIDEAITIYTPIPWGNRFRYMDEASGNYVYEEWAPGSASFIRIWNLFMDDLKVHLDKKGWFEKTYIGINENPLDQTITTAKFIKEHSKKFANGKGWKLTYAGDWHPELKDLLDDYSPVLGKESVQKDVADRKAKGLTTTFYVCCTPQQPNNFVFSAPIEGTYIGWYAAAFGYDGFLRWAYDAWPADPLRDARHTFWPAGDSFLIYPGGVSSIRMEKLTEGIADYEKIRILRERVAASSDKKVKQMWTAFENHLMKFIGDPDYTKRDYDVVKMTEVVRVGKRMLDEISLAVGQ